MKKSMMACFSIILMMLLSSCSKGFVSHDIYGKIYDRYNRIGSYIAVVELTVVSNLTTNTYTLKQYYKAPDKYRVDIVSPENLKGTSYLFSGNKIFLYSNGKGVSLDNYIPNDKDYIFVPDFFGEYYKSEESSAQASRDLTGEQTVLTSLNNGSNKYRFCQKLYIDNKTLIPSKLETYDVNNNPVLTVEFKEFNLNAKLSDDIFNNIDKN